MVILEMAIGYGKRERELSLLLWRSDWMNECDPYVEYIFDHCFGLRGELWVPVVWYECSCSPLLKEAMEN